MIFDAHRTARLLATAGGRQPNPNWSDDQVRSSAIRRFHGGTDNLRDMLRLAVHRLEQIGVPYALVGSFAGCIWGETRLTYEIEIVVDMTPSQAESICHTFPSPEHQIRQHPAANATSPPTQLDIVNPTSGSRIVIMAAGRTAWATAQLNRRKQLHIFADQTAGVAAPEDVILSKLVYYRDGGSELELRDVAGILRVSNDLINRNYVEQFARRFGVLDLWEVMLNTID